MSSGVDAKHHSDSMRVYVALRERLRMNRRNPSDFMGLQRGPHCGVSVACEVQTDRSSLSCR